MSAPAKLTPEIVRRVRYIFEYDRRKRRQQGFQHITPGLRRGMADRIFMWTGIRVSDETVKSIAERKRWKHIKVRVFTGPKRKRVANSTAEQTKG